MHEANLPMEQANMMKLAMILANQRKWKDLIFQGTNRKLMQQLKAKDSRDNQCAMIIENVLDLCP